MGPYYRSRAEIDGKLADIGNRSYVEMPIEDMQSLVNWTVPDETATERVWNTVAITELGSTQNLINRRRDMFTYPAIVT